MAGFTTTVMPYAKTESDHLSPPGWAHHEVVRLSRDFGNPAFQVAVDAWTSEQTPDALGELRFWWVNTDHADQRSPFGSKVRRRIGLRFDENAGNDWTVHLRGDRKEFVFDVEMTDAGAAAFGDVQTDAGVARHCRVTQGRFVARRLLGIPIGLRRLEVDCIDQGGQAQHGSLPFTKLKRGRGWSDD